MSSRRTRATGSRRPATRPASWWRGTRSGPMPRGLLQLGNQQNGICLASSTNTIGGTDGGATNVIEFNGSGRVGAGVQLVGMVNQNTILSNSIYANAGLGINFGSGPTPNHAPGTPGPNDYQNYPVLSVAQDDGVATTVNGYALREPRHDLPHPVLLQPAAGSLRLRAGQDVPGLDECPDRCQGECELHDGTAAVGRGGDVHLGHGDRSRRGIPRSSPATSRCRVRSTSS